MVRIVRFHKTGGLKSSRSKMEVPPPGKGEVQIPVNGWG